MRDQGFISCQRAGKFYLFSKMAPPRSCNTPNAWNPGAALRRRAALFQHPRRGHGDPCWPPDWPSRARAARAEDALMRVQGLLPCQRGGKFNFLRELAPLLDVLRSVSGTPFASLRHNFSHGVEDSFWSGTKLVPAIQRRFLPVAFAYRPGMSGDILCAIPEDSGCNLGRRRSGMPYTSRAAC